MSRRFDYSPYRCSRSLFDHDGIVQMDEYVPEITCLVSASFASALTTNVHRSCHARRDGSRTRSCDESGWQEARWLNSPGTATD
jgi:hypothetical protein